MRTAGFNGCKKATAIAVLLMLAGALSPAIAAARLSENTRQKEAAESRRANLQQQLADLKREMEHTESAKSHAEESLAQSEKAISDANRTLYELAGKKSEAEAHLAELTKQHDDLERTITDQKNRMAQLLRTRYVDGDEDRAKLLLSGDDPNRISRELQYLGYISQAQARLVESLRANLETVEQNETEAQKARDELAEIERSTQEQKALLEQEKAQHASLLAQLSTKLASQRKQAGTIQHDEQRLGNLVDKLSRLIEEQRRAEAAEREKRRREQAALAEKKAREAKGKLKKADANDNAQQTKSLARNELTPEDAIQDEAFPRSFAGLRGRLRLPVKGDIIAKFGSKRSEGPPWKGLFIRAPEGAEVKAVADGRVVFADWLRGFGNLIIVDHGNQYMTIYGNNQAVLKHAGDVVKTGDTIAAAGNSGGNEQSGLYFEMRYQGRAFDPLDWVTLR
jgi:septal ring factor EnvC (AmiA/AmiB activator)